MGDAQVHLESVLAKTELPDDSFVREVDEEYRRDQLKSLWQRYGRALVIGVVLGLVVLAGVLYWREARARDSGATGEAFVQALAKIETGDIAAAAPELQKLANSDAAGYQALAQLTQAANKVKGGDNDAGIKLYKAVAANAALAQPFRDLALIKATRLEFDVLAPDVIISRMKPLSTPGNPWFGVAGEMTGIAYIKSGKPDLAEPLFTAIANDASLEASLRGRAAQLAAALAGAAGRTLNLPGMRLSGDQAAGDPAADNQAGAETGAGGTAPAKSPDVHATPATKAQ